ncbi:MAG: hypothetical protein ACLQGT_05945 [Terracidiphilus sp.]
MAESCLNIAKRETERLMKKIEALEESIRLHNETKKTWNTIVRNTGGKSSATVLEIAHSETERLNAEIEAVQEEIRRHIETRDAWDMIVRNAGCKARLYQDVTYVSGEDGKWHLQRLDMEIEALQGEIRLHSETKDAWNTVVCRAGSELNVDFLEMVHSESELLNKKIEAVQDKIRRYLETKDAWVTILRNAGSQTRIYMGASYIRGVDGLWHLQRSQASESNKEFDSSWTDQAISKASSVRNRLVDACEKTFLKPQNHIPLAARGNEQFQTLGL